MPNSQLNESVDRRRFLAGAAGCCCLGFVPLEQSANAQGRAGVRANPLLTPIAFCGLFCGRCGSLQDTVAQGKPDGCLGCKSNMLGGHCAKCEVRKCAISRRLVNCGLCGEYPCDKIKEYHSDDNEGKYMALSRKNTEDFMYFGDDPEWAEKQLKRWSCSKCGMPFRFESKMCANCGAPVASGEMEAALYARRKTPGFVEFDGKSWQNNLAYRTETKTVGGKKTLQVVGNERTMVLLPNAKFGDGTLECDIMLKNGGAGLAFRTTDDGTQGEIIQFRIVNTQKERNKRVIVYSHHRHWLTGWRELRRENPGKYDVETKLAKDKWFRLKLVVQGPKVDVFIDKGDTPVLSVDRMLGQRNEGGIALYGEDAWFANFAVG